MSPTNPEIDTDRFHTFLARLHVTRKRAVSRIFQWLARKAQQCKQRMADFVRSASASMAEQCFQPALINRVAFAPVRLARCELGNSKGDFYFHQGR